MGRKRTKHLELPKGMRARTVKGSRANCRESSIYYTYDAGGKPRREILLAKNSLPDAIRAYEELIGKLTGGQQDSLLGHPRYAVDQSDAGRLFTTMLKGAKRRSIPVEIGEEDVLQLLITSEFRCQVTGIKFNTYKPSGARMRPWLPSIDRIKPDVGYIRTNVRVVCACVNLALNQFGDDVFMAIAKAAVDRAACVPQSQKSKLYDIDSKGIIKGKNAEIENAANPHG